MLLPLSITFIILGLAGIVTPFIAVARKHRQIHAGELVIAEIVYEASR